MSKLRIVYRCFVCFAVVVALGRFYLAISDNSHTPRSGQIVSHSLLGTSVAAAEDTEGVKADAESKAADDEAYETLTLRGKVRYLGPALKERYGIDTVPESAERQIVLDIPNGELVPLVEDIRGRAFRADERLRKMEVELLVRRHKHSPFAQVIRLSEVKKDGLFVVDYWCDVCAIAMYELKPCDCCQAPNRLRLRRVTPDGIADEEQ